MSVTNAIPEIWSAMLTKHLERQAVWGGTMTDRSAELEDGNELHLNKITSYPTVRQYVRNADIADPERPDTSDTVLTLNQEKYFNIGMEDVDRVQTRPDLLSEFTRMAGYQMAKTIDEYFRNRFENALTSEHTLTYDESDIGALGTDAARTGIANKFLDVVESMDTDGRSCRG